MELNCTTTDCFWIIHTYSGVGTIERLGGATSVENVGPEGILHKIKHVAVKLIHETTHC